MESSPDSVKPSDTGEEGGLASPPLDFAALADYGTLLAPDSSIQLSDKVWKNFFFFIFIYFMVLLLFKLTDMYTCLLQFDCGEVL